MIFDGIFKNKKDDTEVKEQPKASLPDAVSEALTEIFPALLEDVDNCDAYTGEELVKQISGANVEKLLILAEFFFGRSQEQRESNEKGSKFFANTTAIIYAEIQRQLQSAERVFVIMDHCLKSEYPYIADGEVFMFFDETRANQWCALCNASANKPLAVRAIDNKGIPNIFVLMTIIGADFVRFHPEINNLKIKREDIFKCEVKTVSDSKVRFFMLNYVQLLNTKKKEQTKQAYAAMMGSIAIDKFLLVGIEENGMFRASTIADGEGVIWLPLFTDQLEYSRFLETFPALKPKFEKAVLKIIVFTGLKDMLNYPEAGGVVINPADVGLKIKSDTCAVLIENALKLNKNKS